MFCYGSDKTYIVDLESRTYNYGRFQLDQIPCPHTIVVLKSKNVDDMSSYCSDYHKLATLVRTYEVSMIPISNMKDTYASKC